MQNEETGMGATPPAITEASASDNANRVEGEYALSPAEQGAEKMRAEFESLIKGRFKELYDERVGGAVKRRLRGMSAQVKRLEALSPTLRSFAEARGIDESDTEALGRALSLALGCDGAKDTGENNFENKSADTDASHGVPGQKTDAKTAQASKDSSAAQTDGNGSTDRITGGTEASGTDGNATGAGNADGTLDTRALARARDWAAEACEVAGIYPDFDLRTEIGNPRFRSLLRGGVGVRDAYEVVHRDELLPAAMRSAALSAVNQLTDSIAGGAVRPAENGVSATLPYACAVGSMTRAERDDLARRVARGERIVL